MVMYANEFKTKENQKLAEIQKLTATYALQHLPHPPPTLHSPFYP